MGREVVGVVRYNLDYEVSSDLAVATIVDTVDDDDGGGLGSCST